MAMAMEEQFAELREAFNNVELFDAHAHNLVALDSTVPFLRCFSDAAGDALSYAPHTFSFKTSMRGIAELYGCELSMQGVQEYQKYSGLESITSKCFKAAGLSSVLIDDGLELDKKLDIEWHQAFVPFVGRILRIERLAEDILAQGSKSGKTWTLDTFSESFLEKLKSVASKIAGLKSIAAYRSGLEINPNVMRKEAEEGFDDVLRAGKPIRIMNKNFIDYVFVRSLEVAVSFDLPMQIHVGFTFMVRNWLKLHWNRVLGERSTVVGSGIQGVEGRVLVQYYGKDESVWVDPARDLSLFEECFKERSCNPTEEFQNALKQALYSKKCLKSSKYLFSSPDRPCSSDHLGQSPDKGNSSSSIRAGPDYLGRGRSKRERKPTARFDEVRFPLKSVKKVRRFRIMRFLGLAAPVGSPFVTTTNLRVVTE